MLHADALSKAYRGTGVVSGVELDVTPGRIVGLVGANGAGKTTTLKMLAGVLEPTEGSALLEGRPTTRPAARERIGFLPENARLYEEQTARDYLSFFGSLYGLDADRVDRRARALLDRLELAPEARDKRLGTLSKGMRRKVAIARTLLHDPEVLLLDEPTGGLDPLTAREMEGFVEGLRERGKAILLSAHDLPQVEQLCQEVVVMHEGSVAARGRVDELRERAGTRTYTLRATEPFPESRPRGSVHEADLASWEAVERAIGRVRERGGDVVEVDASLPGLGALLQRLAEA